MSKKRYFAAFGAAGLMFAGVYGAAASLDIGGGNAQAGVEGLTCDSDGVFIDGLSIEQGTGTGPESVGVTVSGISDSCEGYYLTGRALGDGGALLSLSDAPQIPDGGGTVKLRWQNAPLLVEDVNRVGLAIT